MKNISLQKMGGIAALYEGLAYIVAMVGFLLVVGWPDDPAKQVEVITNNQIVMHILYIIAYQIFAIFLVILAIALYERLKANSPAILKAATAIGIIWATVVIASGMIFNIGMETVIDLYSKDPAQAVTVWHVINSICDGLGGGNEILGGFWIILISWSTLRAGGLPKALNYIGVMIGVSGVLSALPRLGDVGYIFGLGQIVWFLWLGIVLLRNNSRASSLS